jgi:hypothetical protein
MEYGWGVFAFLKFWGKREYPKFEIKVESPRERKGGALVVIGIAIELFGGVGVVVQSDRIESHHRRDIEKLRADNLNLELQLSPRVFDNQDVAAKALRPFVPMGVAIEYLPDWECQKTAGQIAFVLHLAHWSISGVKADPNASRFSEEVIVANPELNAQEDLEASKKTDAADALIRELNRTNIKAESRGSDPDFPFGTIVVRVGLRPNPRMERILKRRAGMSGNTFSVE